MLAQSTWFHFSERGRDREITAMSFVLLVLSWVISWICQPTKNCFLLIRTLEARVRTHHQHYHLRRMMISWKHCSFDSRQRLFHYQHCDLMHCHYRQVAYQHLLHLRQVLRVAFGSPIGREGPFVYVALWHMYRSKASPSNSWRDLFVYWIGRKTRRILIIFSLNE